MFVFGLSFFAYLRNEKDAAMRSRASLYTATWRYALFRIAASSRYEAERASTKLLCSKCAPTVPPVTLATAFPHEDLTKKVEKVTAVGSADDGLSEEAIQKNYQDVARSMAIDVGVEIGEGATVKAIHATRVQEPEEDTSDSDDSDDGTGNDFLARC